jgi:hypothetical protein
MKNPSSNRITAFLTVAIIAIIPFALPAQNLVTNGGFELGPFNPAADGFEDDSPGDASLAGWTVLGLTINRGINSNPYGIKTEDGDFFMDLTGHQNVPPYGGVSQTIATVIGGRYYFSFKLGTYQDDPTFSGPIAVLASAGTNSMQFTYDPRSTGNQWATFGFVFSADDAATTVSLAGVSGKNYIGLDAVSVVPTTGLPSPMLRIHAPPVELEWDTVPSAVYQLQFSSNLASAEWLLLSTNVIAGTGGPVSTNDPSASSYWQRFYRLVVTNAPGF